ncbi:hypothetical protein [uncultured Microscilla sp.]|uniref:hypothetical protein n=1 Tax=uncultured Microscilla sp. TaxID=432653 RepID=UPI002630BC46|nr:hypothetical protein [uncultured Microscilla sp.]
MKRIVLIGLVIIALIQGVCAQGTDKNDIRKTMQEYATALKTSGNKGGLLFVYPKVFGLANKQEVLQRMDNKKETSKHLIFERIIVTHISETMVVDGVKYVLVNYQDEHSHSLAQPQQVKNADNIAAALAATHTASKNPQAKKMILASNRQAYAVKELTYKGWKLVERNAAMKDILQKVLPQQVLKLP